MSRVHWNTTARLNKLMSKVFDLGRASEVWVMPDLEAVVHAGELEESTDEYAVSIAASLAQRYLDAELPVGLIAHGAERYYLPAETGNAQLNRIMRYLAVSKADGETPLSIGVAREEPLWGHQSSLIVITPSPSEDWVIALRELARRGVKVVVVLVDGGSFGGSLNTLDAVEPLYDAGASVVRGQKGRRHRRGSQPTQRCHWQLGAARTGRGWSESMSTGDVAVPRPGLEGLGANQRSPYVSVLERLGPKQGWDSFFLLTVAVGVAAWTVREADWVETPGLLAIVFLSSLTGLALAKLRLPWMLSHVVGLSVGSVIVVWQTSSLVPDEPLTGQVREMWNRLGVWYEAVTADGISTDLLPFTPDPSIGGVASRPRQRLVPLQTRQRLDWTAPVWSSHPDEPQLPSLGLRFQVLPLHVAGHAPGSPGHHGPETREMGEGRDQVQPREQLAGIEQRRRS